MNNRNIIIASIISSCVFLIFFIYMTTHATDSLQTFSVSQYTLEYLFDTDITIDGNTQNVHLPYTITNLSPNTPVVLYATFEKPQGDYIYIETQYTPVTVYQDNVQIHEYGQKGSYASYMQDPPLSGRIIPLNATDSAITLEIEYLAPSTVTTFTINPILFGSQSDIFLETFKASGFSFVFGFLLVSAGMVLLIGSIFIATIQKSGFTTVWFALSSLSIGVWILGTCPLSTLLLGTPIQRYICGLVGMIAFPITLIYFGLSVVNFHNKKTLLLTALLHGLIAWSLFSLMINHVITPITIYNIFRVLVPLSVSIFAGYMLYEGIHHKNKFALRFTLPSTVFALFILLEFSNMYLYFATPTISFLQIGIIFFIFSMGFLVGLFLKDTYAMELEQKRTKLELKLLEYQVSEQKRNSLLMIANEEAMKKQRHDLRHQLIVIKELYEQKKGDELLKHLSSLMNNIPSSQTVYCKNTIANAVVSHYVTLAKTKNIDCTIQIEIPAESEQLTDVDYCIILGNLLENAIEACDHIPVEERFIRLKSHLHYSTLTITMDNSFDGNYHNPNGRVLSRKRNDFGIGLSSVQSVAKENGGDAQFKPNGRIFLSSVYFTI